MGTAWRLATSTDGGMQEQDFNLGENIESAVPDCQICSAGRSEGGRCAPMDNEQVPAAG